MTVSLILDGVVAVLLVATIAYCVILNRRLAAMRGNQDEFRRIVASFNEATTRAEAGIAHLKLVGKEIDRVLKEQVGEAQALYDELVFLTDHGDRLAGRLGDSISAARGLAAELGDGIETGGETLAAESPRGLSKAERELIEALDQEIGDRRVTR